VLLEADTIVQMRIRDMLACAFFLVSRMCESVFSICLIAILSVTLSRRISRQ